MQLIRVLPAALAVALFSTVAHADVEGASHLTVFREPSSREGSKGVTVVHPQGDVSANVGTTFNVNAGYELDIVSGATPRVFGPAAGPDAVTAATGFSDTRHAARGGLGFETQTVGVSGGYSYGWENDYRSHTITAAVRGDFLERNFTLGLAYTRNFDSVCDQNNSGARSPLDFQPLGNADTCFKPDSTTTVTQRLHIDSFEPTLTWTVTPTLMLQGGGTLQLLDGFQSNPYRAVLIGSQGRTPQEHLPGQRQRFALFARVHQAVPVLRAALQGFARVYRDSWDVMAATAEANVLKYLGPSIIVGLRGRYHQQTEAAFYRSGIDYRTLGAPGAYWTGDRELSPFSTWLVGAKLTYLHRRQQEARAFIEEVEVTVKTDILVYRLSEGSPNADRKSALVTQAGLTARF